MCDTLKIIIIPLATLLSATIGCAAVWWTSRSLDKRAFRQQIASVIAALDCGEELIGEKRLDILIPVAEAVFSIAPILSSDRDLLLKYAEYKKFCNALTAPDGLTGTYIAMLNNQGERQKAQSLLTDVLGAI